MQRVSRGVVGLVFLVLGCLRIAQAEDFELIVDGQPELTSRARLVGAKLTVTDATGSTYLYERHSAFDSTDGDLLGYRSLAAGTALRWPAFGTGSMWLGDLAGTMWRQSLQRVTPIGGAAMPPGAVAIHGPGGIACLSGPAGAAWVAHVGGDGRMRCYRGSLNAWKYRELPLKTPLIPGSPVIMYHAAGAWPGILTTSPAGRMVTIVDGTVVHPVSTSVSFPPGAHLATLVIGSHQHAFAIDIQGRLWDMDIDTRLGSMVEPSPGAFPPGAPLAVFLDGTIPVVTAVNTSSVLIAYGKVNGGWSPATVGAGYTPGTHIASTSLLLGGIQTRFVAAINWSGQLQLWQKSGFTWLPASIPTALLAPGSPVEIGQTPFGPVVSAIGADGIWHTWISDASGAWSDAVIGAGYPLGAPLAILADMGTIFTVDSLGRLMVSYFDANSWNVGYVLPTLEYTPRLVSRQVIPNPSLPPARVQLANSSSDDLILQIVDQFQPHQPEEIKIPKNSAVNYSLERDAGSRLEEVFLVPGPGGRWIEQTQTYPVPPQQRYTLVAWTNKVTYRYIDQRKSKPAGALPSFDLKTHNSLGVIPIPPGPALRVNESLDIPEIARGTNNPGAARFFPLPVSPPVTLEQRESE